MNTVASRVDLVIQKGAKFYVEFQQLEEDEVTPISLVGYSIRCRVKESFNSSVVLHELTTANGGVTIINAAQGSFMLNIAADQTNKNVDYAVYDIVLINDTYPGIEDERIIEGKITYTKKV